MNDGRGRPTEHGTSDIIHIRAMSTDGLLGLSPIRQARQAKPAMLSAYLVTCTGLVSTFKGPQAAAIAAAIYKLAKHHADEGDETTSSTARRSTCGSRRSST